MRRFRLLQQSVVTAGLLALCGLPAAVRAQDAPQGTMQAQDQAAPGRQGQDEELAKLNLSDDQKTQVKKIHEDMKAKMDALRSDSSLTADEQRARAQEIRKSSHERVKQILTPDQRKQMKSDEMARKAARQQGGQAPPPQQ